MALRTQVYRVVVLLAVAWALANCAYVYLVRGGQAAYRIESAVILLVVVLAALAARRRGAMPPPTTRPAAAALSARATWLLLAGMAMVWLATYLPLAAFPFLSDDYVFLELYRSLDEVDRSPQFFRPVFAFVFWLLAAASARSPELFHAVSFSLHLASSWLVFRLAERLLADPGRAGIAATVFLLNPLQAEAVLWISGLQELLWSFFALAAMAVYVGARELSGKRLASTLALAALALFSKETAVCLVLLLPAADAAFFAGRRGRWQWAGYGLLVMEVLAYLGVRAQYATIPSSFLPAPSRYFFKQFFTLPYRFFVQPWNTAAVDVPGAVMALSAMGVVVLLAWAVAVRRESRGVLAGAFVILASTLPVYSYFFVREDLLAARYLYFAAAGWGLILATLLGAAMTGRRALATALVSVGLVLTTSLHLNLRPWRAAADVIDVAAVEAVDPRPSGDLLRDWQQRQRIPLVLRGPVPIECQGVLILANGYDEFVRHVRRRAAGS